MTVEESELHYKLRRFQQYDCNVKHLQEIHYKGSQVSSHFQIDPEQLPAQDNNAKIFYFDIDNTLYSSKLGINKQMQVAILEYMRYVLKIDDYDEALQLLQQYYHEYGISLYGFMNDYGIDPLEYNKLVDDSLDLNDLLKPNAGLRHMLINLKSSGAVDKLWLFTNAYKTHALRCVRLLGIADLFDGITYCDYANETICKPDIEFYQKVKLESGLGDWKNAFFVDDNLDNVKTGMALGIRRCFHLDENRSSTSAQESERIVTIDHLSELPKLI